MIDVNGPTWQTIRAHLTARLAILRSQNDNPRLNDLETAALRGEIQAVKKLLALPENIDAAPVESGEPDLGLA